MDGCKVIQTQNHSFLPFSLSALGKDDAIRITIQNGDTYTLPCDSYMRQRRREIIKRPFGAPWAINTCSSHERKFSEKNSGVNHHGLASDGNGQTKIFSGALVRIFLRTRIRPSLKTTRAEHCSTPNNIRRYDNSTSFHREIRINVSF